MPTLHGSSADAKKYTAPYGTAYYESRREVLLAVLFERFEQ